MKETEQKEGSVEKILALAMDKLKNVADTSCIIGEKMDVGPITLVPISKVCVGYISGGGEYGETKRDDAMVSGGSGGGYSIQPVGFISIHNATGEVKMLNIDGKNSFDKLFELVPKIIASIKGTYDGGKK